MGEKRRWGNWDRGCRDVSERWPSKLPRRWGQQNHAGFNAWGEEEGLPKSESNGWGEFYSSAPSWVRTFCTSVCRVPWRKICNARRMIFTYKNVGEWDDSAGQEAFENAKARYWARINHLPCDLTLPDPYMYIDKVNFDTFLDPELAEDLERCAFNPDTDNQSEISRLDTVAPEPVPTTGWVETEHSSSNWDKYAEKQTSRWDSEIAECDPWASRKNQSVDSNGMDSSWKPQVRWKDQKDSWKHQEGWKNARDRTNTGWNYMNSRHQMADDQMNRNWNNSNSFQKTVQPQRMWRRSELWGSRNHQTAGYSGPPWQQENVVS